jgi:uncharacterized protein
VQIALLFFTIFLAAFTQSLAGFGSALVAMAILPPLLGLQITTPLVALLTLVLEIGLVIYFREALNVKNIWRVVAAALVGIPLGVLYLKQVNETVAMFILGLVITGYAVYGLLKFRLPRLEHTAWGYLAGLFAGLLGGAYNTSGPPVIMYAACRGWEPAEFKGNLQGFFLVSSLVVASSHGIGGSFTPDIWRYFFLSLPFLGLGSLSGLLLDKRINPAVFRQLILVLLFVLGLRLTFSFI